MPKYKGGTLGKLVVQDWDVVSGYPDIPLLFILTRQQAAALVSVAETFNWLTRWKNPPGIDVIDAFASETLFNLMNPITCEMLTDCIEPLFDNLRAQIKQDALFSQYGTEYPVGVPLPPEALTAPLAPGSNPTCNLDILWAQSEQIVDYSNTMISDVLEQLETATNNVELAQVITSLPILDELGADAIAGYIELLVDGIAENYTAEYDLAYKTGLACEIFCAAQFDCEITIELVYEILLARVTAHFGSPGAALDQIGNLLSYLLDQDIETDVIVDSLMFLLWGSNKLINSFFSDVGSVALQTVMELAVNDANDDWSILCDCGWYSEMDVTTDDYTWVANPDGFNWGNWTDTVGFVSGFDVSEGNAYQMVQIRLEFSAPAEIRRMAFDYDLTSGTQVFGLVLNVGTDNVNVGQTDVPANGSDLTYDKELVDLVANYITLRCQAGFVPASSSNPGGSSIVKRIRVWGTGAKPSELP